MNRLGIDIGGSSVKAVQWDGIRWLNGQSEHYRDPMRTEIVDAVRSAIGGFSGGVVSGVGVCMPGRVSSDGSRIELSLNMPALNGWAFDEMFEDFGLPPDAAVCSDAVAAGTDYVRTHALNGRAACVAIGTGVGLAVFDNGVPVGIGERGIGHLGMIEVERGVSLERAVGAGALNERFGESIDAGIDAMGDDDPVIRALVAALRLIHAIYVPRDIILLGGVGLAMSRHSDRLDRLVRDGLCPVTDPEWKLRFGSSMFHAAMGAARLANH